MALSADDVQEFLGAEENAPWGQRSLFRSDSGEVGRTWLDGVLVIYDLQDAPIWLTTVLEAQDDDGNTGLDEPRQVVG